MLRIDWRPGCATCWDDGRPEPRQQYAVQKPTSDKAFRSPYAEEMGSPKPWYHYGDSKKPVTVGRPRAKSSRGWVSSSLRRPYGTREGATVTHKFVRRFLERFVGKSWAKAYSRLAYRYDSRSRAGCELAWVLKYEVVKDLHGRSGSFYVDDAGLLQRMPSEPKVNSIAKSEVNDDKIELNQTLEAEKLEGSWYLDRYQVHDPEELVTRTFKDPRTLTVERVTRTRREWELPNRERVTRKQASKKEIKTYGLRTTNPAALIIRRANDRTHPLRGHGRLQGQGAYC